MVFAEGHGVRPRELKSEVRGGSVSERQETEARVSGILTPKRNFSKYNDPLEISESSLRDAVAIATSALKAGVNLSTVWSNAVVDCINQGIPLTAERLYEEGLKAGLTMSVPPEVKTPIATHIKALLTPKRNFAKFNDPLELDQDSLEQALRVTRFGMQITANSNFLSKVWSDSIADDVGNGLVSIAKTKMTEALKTGIGLAFSPEVSEALKS
ncbi:MAG: hypothetical protein KGH64_03715 [Candidatus Micrarchaeota archaeon]|nr:hypothetical protein [Candidatus Micrarchaeota archaeon]MDE1834417.1 hypothetical protein [Candidatus Micrarchaeota archaeon]MDE1859468.1 hypothetical protein [Candidatus Micrarchaeota archaeon]